jgi:hypothetical protein
MNILDEQALAIRIAEVRAKVRKLSEQLNVLRGITPPLDVLVAGEVDRRTRELDATMDTLRVLVAQRDGADPDPGPVVAVNLNTRGARN